MRSDLIGLGTHLRLDKDKVYYLASPYSHPDIDRMQARYEAIDYIGALLFWDDITVIEPIASCHNKSLLYGLPGGYEAWQKRDRTFIERSDGIILTRLEGWKTSKGMLDEAKYAYDLGKDIHYIDAQDFSMNEYRQLQSFFSDVSQDYE